MVYRSGLNYRSEGARLVIENLKLVLL